MQKKGSKTCMITNVFWDYYRNDHEEAHKKPNCINANTYGTCVCHTTGPPPNYKKTKTLGAIADTF